MQRLAITPTLRLVPIGRSGDPSELDQGGAAPGPRDADARPFQFFASIAGACVVAAIDLAFRS